MGFSGKCWLSFMPFYGCAKVKIERLYVVVFDQFGLFDSRCAIVVLFASLCWIRMFVNARALIVCSINTESSSNSSNNAAQPERETIRDLFVICFPNTEAYKFNGLVYRAVYNGIEPSSRFATISVKCVRWMPHNSGIHFTVSVFGDAQKKRKLRRRTKLF